MPLPSHKSFHCPKKLRSLRYCEYQFNIVKVIWLFILSNWSTPKCRWRKCWSCWRELARPSPGWGQFWNPTGPCWLLICRYLGGESGIWSIWMIWKSPLQNKDYAWFSAERLHHRLTKSWRSCLHCGSSQTNHRERTSVGSGKWGWVVKVDITIVNLCWHFDL